MKKKLPSVIAFCLLITYTGFAQTNLNFESWTGNEPNGWTTFNAIPTAPQTTFKETSNPGQGTFFVKMVTGVCLAQSVENEYIVFCV